MAVNEPEADTFVTTAPRSTRPVGGGGGSPPHPAATPSTATSPSATSTRAPERRAEDSIDELVCVIVTTMSPCVFGLHAVQRLSRQRVTGSSVSVEGLSKSLVPKGFDGPQSRGPVGRVATSDEPNHKADREREHHRRDGYCRSERGEGRAERGREDRAEDRQPDPHPDTNDPAEPCQHERLDEELLEDRPSRGTDRFSDANLPGSLGHRDQHDVQDSDRTDEKRDRRDGGREESEDSEDLIEGVEAAA